MERAGETLFSRPRREARSQRGGQDNDCDGMTDEGGVCPTGCTGASFGGHAYLYCAPLLAWSAAQTACTAVTGFRLVRIDSASENSWVSSTRAARGLSSFIWIGASDATVEGSWRWTDGAVFWSGTSTGSAVGGLYNNWDVPNGDPDGDSATPQDCARMTSTGTWLDINCATFSYGYVCEQY